MAEEQSRQLPASKHGDLSKEKHGRKAPMWVINARVEYVSELIALGFTYTEIAQHIADSWGISVRMIDEYCRRAREQLEEAAEKARPDHLARHIKLRESLLEMALDGKDPDIRAALAVADSEAKLLGLVQERHKHEGKVEHEHDHQLLPTTPEQIEEARKRLQAAREKENADVVSAEVVEEQEPNE